MRFTPFPSQSRPSARYWRIVAAEVAFCALPTGCAAHPPPCRRELMKAKKTSGKSPAPKGPPAGSDGNPHKRLESERIANDIADYEKSGGKVEKLVANDRFSTSLIERLTIWEKAARGIRGTFSRIRSNTMIVS